MRESSRTVTRGPWSGCWRLGWLVVACVLVACGGARAAGPPKAAAEAATPAGVAAKYPGDRGLAKDAGVIFADDFESWTAAGTQPPAGGWNVRKNKTGQTRTVPGKVDGAAAGSRVLEIACWPQGKGSSVGGLSKKLGNYDHAKEGLGPGHEELYVRYYVKFDPAYRAVQNHGANLGGRDVTRAGSAWVGMAGIRDVSSRGYFYSGLQPRGKLGGTRLEMGFYSYHLDKRGPWGENYPVRTPLPFEVGGWHCVERRLKLNSVVPAKSDPAAPDGAEELWVDGRLSIRKTDVRFRRTPNLRITLLSFETYYHGLPEQYTRDKPIKVYFDNLVIARRYIGPMAGPPGRVDKRGMGGPPMRPTGARARGSGRNVQGRSGSAAHGLSRRAGTATGKAIPLYVLGTMANAPPRRGGTGGGG